MKNKIAGALFGVAVGDALGGPIEFMDAKTITQKYGRVETMIGGGWLDLAPGETTDDTAMTLAVAEGIMENPDNPCQAIGRRFIEWMNSGPKDIGTTCMGGISRAVMKAKDLGLKEPDIVCWNYGGRATADISRGHNCGNGALMRAIYPSLYYREAGRAVQETINQGRMTHWAVDSDEACKIYAMAVHCVIDAATAGLYEPAAMLRGIFDTVKGTIYDVEEIKKQKCCGKLNPTGYVVDSLKCALFALWEEKSFKEAVIGAANMGGDADTIAAICGGLAGAVYGYGAIPEDWVALLPVPIRKRIEVAVEAAVKNRMDV